MESFAGQVSHDLRTPLSAVHLALSMLGEIPAVHGDATAQRLTLRAQAVFQRMQNTLEDLMDFATLGSTVQPEGGCTFWFELHMADGGTA